MSDEAMIERVGRAIESKWNSLQDLPPIELTAEEAGELGRAAIEAMRRPTLAMLRAAWAADESHTIPRDELVKVYPDEDMPPSGDVGFVLDYDNKGLEIIVGAWEAMIDAALNEKAAADP